jgi:hypothetical protein
MRFNRFFLLPLLVTLTTFVIGCGSSTVTTTNTDSSTINSASVSPSTSNPVKYSVVCFSQSYANKCGDQYYKVPEGTTVKAYLKKTGGGIGGNVVYESSMNIVGNYEVITRSESDELVNNGAKAYLIVELSVRFFDRSSGEFVDIPEYIYTKFEEEIFDPGKETIFTTGETFKLIEISSAEELNKITTRKSWNSLCGGARLGYATCKLRKVVSYSDIKDTTGQASQQPEPNKSAVSNQASAHPSAAEFIQKYYQLLNERNYSNSWNKLSTNFQNKSQDYKQWWDKVKNIRVSSVKNISQDENMAIVEAQISYELKDGRVKQDDNKQIHLLWNKAKNEWEIDK